VASRISAEDTGLGSQPLPPTPDLTAPFPDSNRLPRVELVWGEGRSSVDPYLLRMVEASSLDLVARQSLYNGVDSAWSTELRPSSGSGVESPGAPKPERAG
jgi:hypothetical protein